MGRGGGKKQHSKDRMYLLQSEWQYEGGGYKNKGGRAAQLPYRLLPFNCCALSLAPFQDPMMTPKGVVYDMLNIIPYVNKNKRCAVTGDTLHLRDLTKLTFHTNEKGEHHCPVMFKTFTPHTHIVANKASGHVYCFEAVETLCYKTKNFKDLMAEVPFTKQDIITLQDPHNFGHREIEAFNHIKMGEETRASKVAEMAVSDETRRILIKAGLAKEGEVGSKRASQATVAPEAKRAKDSEADLKRKTGVSSGAMAASFTSTALDVAYQVEEQVMTEKEQAQEKYKIMRKLGKKGYVQMRTNYGDLNLEVRADWAPMTAENFLTLCSRNYYDGVSFHRLIKNFMVQGGDPTGTGKGGESCWGGKFDDEFDSRLRHEGRGVLSMANSGKNANGSQFFITLKSCPHLNNKHSVFGSVVGGLDILTKIERVETDSLDKPKEEIKVLGTTVFVNPFDSDLKVYYQEEEEKKQVAEDEAARRKKRELEDREGHRDWYTNPAGAAKQTAYKPAAAIGKYIAPAPAIPKNGGDAPAAAPVVTETAEGQDIWADAVPKAKSKQQARSSLGDFSGW